MDIDRLALFCLNAAMNLANLTPKQLRAAAKIQEKIETLQGRLATLLDGEAVKMPAIVAKPSRPKMSVAHKAAIRAAQKARWKRFWVKKKVA